MGGDQERLNDEGMRKALKKYNQMNFTSLLKQVQAEYDLCWIHQHSRIQQNLDRLKLYNNQKRDKNLVGDPLLFGIIQTTLAALYDDELTVAFEAREEGDVDTTDNLDNLARYDADVMDKAVLDYIWIFDTLFVGRGLLLLHEFDRSDEVMAPMPEVYDPMTFLRDPLATSVNGYHYGRPMRFGGRELMRSKGEMEANGNYINMENLKEGKSIKSLFDEAERHRNQAFGLDQLFGKDNKYLTANIGSNSSYHTLEWFTHWDGKKCRVELGNQMKLVVRYEELGDADDSWPLIDRSLYPTSHSWEGVSIPDLVEDKQRQRSVALNLGIEMMKADLYPTYLYNEAAIKNPKDLHTYVQKHKFIPVKKNYSLGEAMQPANKATPSSPLLDFIFQTLDTSAQRATATPEMQQGQLSQERRTLGELNLVASRVDKRFNLAAKIFGWSERDFWRQWYWLYKENFKEKIDEKVIRINGAFGSDWRPLSRENIISKIDPDISIDSMVVSESKRNQERVLLATFSAASVANNPQANRRYMDKKLARLNGLTKDEIDRLYPPTVDELLAEEENEKINNNEVPEISENDNHVVHWEVHSKAAETESKKAHMNAHKEAMRIQRDQPELFPQQQQQGINPTAPEGENGGGGTNLNINPSELLDQVGQSESQLASRSLPV